MIMLQHKIYCKFIDKVLNNIFRMTGRYLDAIGTIFAQCLGNIWTIPRKIHIIFGQCTLTIYVLKLFGKYSYDIEKI